jgi:hypothetical protein
VRGGLDAVDDHGLRDPPGLVTTDLVAPENALAVAYFIPEDYRAGGIPS